MIPHFPYDPVKRIDVVRRYKFQLRKMVIERVFAFAAIAITLASGWAVILWSLIRLSHKLGILPR